MREQCTWTIEHFSPRVEEHITTDIYYWNLAIHPAYYGVYCLNPKMKNYKKIYCSISSSSSFQTKEVYCCRAINRKWHSAGDFDQVVCPHCPWTFYAALASVRSLLKNLFGHRSVIWAMPCTLKFVYIWILSSFMTWSCGQILSKALSIASCVYS